jgi:hypothetical protein
MLGLKAEMKSQRCNSDAKNWSIWLLLLQRGGEGGNPAIVALEGAAKNQLLSHDGSETMKERGLAE